MLPVAEIVMDLQGQLAIRLTIRKVPVVALTHHP